MLLNAMDSIYNGAIWLVSKGYGGLTFAIDWTHTEVTLLTYKVHDGMIVAKEWSWVQVKWLVWNAFYALMLTTYWTFYIVWWIGSGIWVQIEWIGDAFNFYYYFYLESKLRFCYAHRITTPLNSYYHLLFFFFFLALKDINCVLISCRSRHLYKGPSRFCAQNLCFNIRVHYHQCHLLFEIYNLGCGEIPAQKVCYIRQTLGSLLLNSRDFIKHVSVLSEKGLKSVTNLAA